MKFCPTCGNKITIEKFCSNCGSKIEVSEIEKNKIDESVNFIKENLKSVNNEIKESVVVNHLKRNTFPRFLNGIIDVLGIVGLVTIFGQIFVHFSMNKNFHFQDAYLRYEGQSFYYLTSGFLAEIIPTTILPFLFMFLSGRRKKWLLITSLILMFLLIIISQNGNSISNNNNEIINSENQNSITTDSISSIKEDVIDAKKTLPVIETDNKRIGDNEIIEICKSSPEIKNQFKSEYEISFDKNKNTYNIWCYSFVDDGDGTGHAVTNGRYDLDLNNFTLKDNTLGQNTPLSFDMKLAKNIINIY